LYRPAHIEASHTQTLLVKGQKKKELIMVVKKPSTKLNLKEFGKVVGVVGGAVRMADATALEANLGVATDFVSPLALVNAMDAGIVMHKVVFDAALQDGHTVWCLPPVRPHASFHAGFSRFTPRSRLSCICRAAARAG
jgi:hypothetical protein